MGLPSQLRKPEHCWVRITVQNLVLNKLYHASTATSYIYPDHFDEWSYNVDGLEAAPSQLSAPDVDRESTTLEIPLNTLIECLNIFGTANISSSSTSSKHKKWRRASDGSDDERGEEGRPANANRLDQYFGSNEKRTSMRLSYAGPGHPLTLIL